MSQYELIQSQSVSQWNDESDVIVIGFGMAGACAALGAKEKDADVLVLERGSGISGTTTSATGHFYLGGGTRVQLANDIHDSTEDMFNYLMSITPEPDERKIRAYCDNSINHFQWLNDQGIPFNNGFYKKKHFEQPTDECLIWSGNEKVWPYSEKAKPAPRGHKVEAEGSGGGALAMKALLDTAETKGIRFAYDANVSNLITNETGRIVGVKYTHFKEERFVKAKKGVIIAAGGFAMNNDMIKTHCPNLEHERIFKQGNPNDDGAGINMGVAAGGEALHMDGCLITAPFYPPENLLKAILVNKHGKRYINEDSYHSRSAAASLEQDDQIAYLICDSAIFERPELGLQELIDGYETVEEMEQGLQLPEGSLVKTLTDYNAAAEQGEDPEFHKYKDWIQPLNQPPYAALQCSLNESLYVGFTLGGLKVSEHGEVLEKGSDTPIQGLYAAGACASNIAQDGKGYSSGTCLGESSFFGRRAGKKAALAS